MPPVYIAQSEINEYLEGVRQQYGSYRKAGKAMKINSAYFTFALNGKIYKRLLDALNITTVKPRSRFTCDMNPEDIKNIRAHAAEMGLSCDQYILKAHNLMKGEGELEI